MYGNNRNVENRGSSNCKYPTLYSFIVLRKEKFGGYIFNPFFPPEEKLDAVRYQIASMCDGSNQVEDILKVLSRTLNHSKEYAHMLLKDALNEYINKFYIYWRQSPFESQNGRFIQLESNIGNINYLSAPLFVIWELTGACNLRCRHCLASAGEPYENELDTEEVKRLLDQLELMKVFTINFSGGEPLVRPDIFEILNYASEKHISIDLLSNGYLIDEEMARKLKKTNIFHVQLSLDGTKKTHDEFRGINGSFNRVLEAAHTLKKNDIAVSISTTITKKNIGELSEIIEILIKNEIRAFKTTLFMPSGRGENSRQDYEMSPVDVKEFNFKLMEIKEKVGNKIAIAYEEVYPWLLYPEKYSKAAKRTYQDKIGCTAGNSSMYISADGKVTPCPFLRDFNAGDVRVQSLLEIWHKAAIFSTLRNIKKENLKGKCSSCEYLGSFCFGGCRAAAYSNTKDIFAEDPVCWKV